jgi:plasmid stabilization system protein ParE
VIQRSVVWTDAAFDDLDALAAFIAADSPHYAASFVERVRKTARSLEMLSERGRIVPEFSSESIREVFVQNYRLIYRVEPQFVQILSLIHQHRDLSGLLNPLGLEKR